MTRLTDGIRPVAPPARIKKTLMAQVLPEQRVTISQRLWLWQGVAMHRAFSRATLGCNCLRPNAD